MISLAFVEFLDMELIPINPDRSHRDRIFSLPRAFRAPVAEHVMMIRVECPACFRTEEMLLSPIAQFSLSAQISVMCILIPSRTFHIAQSPH